MVSVQQSTSPFLVHDHLQQIHVVAAAIPSYADTHDGGVFLHPMQPCVAMVCIQVRVYFTASWHLSASPQTPHLDALPTRWDCEDMVKKRFTIVECAMDKQYESIFPIHVHVTVFFLNVSRKFTVIYTLFDGVPSCLMLQVLLGGCSDLSSAKREGFRSEVFVGTDGIPVTFQVWPQLI